MSAWVIVSFCAFLAVVLLVCGNIVGAIGWLLLTIVVCFYDAHVQVLEDTIRELKAINATLEDQRPPINDIKSGNPDHRSEPSTPVHPPKRR